MSRMAPIGRSSPMRLSPGSTSQPAMSDSDSFSAPDWSTYSRPAVRSVTAWVSSWPVTSLTAEAVAVDHLVAVPERVLVVDAVVHEAQQRRAGVVVGVAVERRLV